MTDTQRQDLQVFIRYGGIIVAIALAFAAVRSSTQINTVRLTDHELRIRTLENLAHEQRAADKIMQADISAIKAAVIKP